MRKAASDSRGLQLWDVRDGQKIVVTCTCGQIAHFLPGVLRRLHKLPSDTLVYDLRYRLRCQKCRSRDHFTVTVEEDRWPRD
jgi:hypothetical protein